MSPRRTALVGAIALLVVAELVARLQGDRLCSDRAGVVYERSAVLGWQHVPDLSGWLGTCDGDGLPAPPVEIDSDARLAAMMLPLWNRLPDLAAVYLRLFFVR